MVDHDPWAGDTPYFLLISSLEPNEGGAYGFLVLDVDRPGWQTEHEDWLRRSAEWHLCDKETERVLLSQLVYRGEYPYYVKRHVGQIKLNGEQMREVSVYGIGKRVPAAREGRKVVRQERTDRLWILPGGVVCGGDDVEPLAMQIVQMMDWEAQHRDDDAV